MPTVTKNRQRGFTIVEVIVALAILVFGLGAIYGHMINSARSGQRSIQRMQSRWLAHERLAELRTAPYASLKGWTPGAPVPMSDAVKAVARVGTLPDGSIEVAVDAGVYENQAKQPDNAVTVKGVVAP